MSINSVIKQSDWSDFFTTFSNGNRGRQVSIEIFDPESGSTGQANEGPLMAVDYDPSGKGNDIVITTGKDTIDYSHTITAPVEVKQEQADDGKVAALEIVDQKKATTVLKF